MVGNNDVVSRCQMVLERIIDGKLSLENFRGGCTTHVTCLLSSCKRIYFCGKLPWISNIISYIRDLHSNLEVSFVDLFEGEDVIQLSRIQAIDEDAIYVICSRWHFEEYLNVLGRGKNIIFYPEYLLFLEDKVDSKLFSDKYNYSYHMVNETIANVVENAEKYLECLELLADENSKKLLASIILFRTNFNLDLTKGVKTTKLHYWDEDLYTFSEKDIIVDGGGYTGDSLLTFINGGLKCKEYWLFEPTEAIDSAAKIAGEADFTVHMCRKGLSDLNGEIRFSLRLGSNGELEGVSQIDEEGESVIEVVRLDEYMDKKPTFVKLDVEGSELAALNGGEKCFDERTSFSICAYHKLNDIIDIFEWLERQGGHQLYMRAERNNLMVDYVIYAIYK